MSRAEIEKNAMPFKALEKIAGEKIPASREYLLRLATGGSAIRPYTRLRILLYLLATD